MGIVESGHPESEWVFRSFGIESGANQKLQVLEILGAIMGGVVIAMLSVVAHRRARALEDTVTQTKVGQRHERLKNAILHLGDKSESVRMGAAYELLHLARDVPDWRETILNILCAHVRQTTAGSCYWKRHAGKPSEEIQGILSIITQREFDVFADYEIRLRGAWLKGADFVDGWLQEADLTEAVLQEAKFTNAYMQGAYLSNAQMKKSKLDFARVQWAVLVGADMREADLENAQLQGASMGGVELSGAKLDGAKVHGVTKDRNLVTSLKQRIDDTVGKQSDFLDIVRDGSNVETGVYSQEEAEQWQNEAGERKKSVGR